MLANFSTSPPALLYILPTIYFPAAVPVSTSGNTAVNKGLFSGLSPEGKAGPFVAPNFSANSCVYKVATGLLVLEVKPFGPLYSNFVNAS